MEIFSVIKNCLKTEARTLEPLLNKHLDTEELQQDVHNWLSAKRYFDQYKQFQGNMLFMYKQNIINRIVLERKNCSGQ